MRSSLPKVTSKDPSERRLLEAIKEAVEIGDGVRGDPLDRKLTLRDLVSSGLATIKLSLKTNRYVAGTDIVPGSSGTTEFDLTPPDAPENLVVTQGVSGVFLTWDPAAYGNHAHTNIYRSADNNFSNAVVITNALGSIYSDPIPYEVTDPGTGAIKGYYYWITFVSEAGIEGAPNAVNGEYGEPSRDPDYFLDILSDGVDANAPFFQVDTPTEINGIIIPPGVYIKELFVADGTFGSAKIRDLSVDKLIGDTAAFVTANIANASITSAKIAQSIQSNNYDADNGWYINKDGTAVLNNAVIRGAAQSQGYDTGSQGWQLLADGSFTLRGSGGTVIMSTAGVPMSAVTGAGDLAYLNSIPNGTYIANAIVDTLHLAGQAVTIPVSAYSSGSKNIGASTTAISVSMTSTGSPVFITASCVVNVIDSDAVDSNFTVQLKRGSTVIYSLVVERAYGHTDFDEGGTLWSYKSYPITVSCRTTPSAGSNTFSLVIVNSGGATTKKVLSRSIMCLETKR